MDELPQWTSCVPGAGRRRQLQRQQQRDLLMLDEDIPTVVPYIAELVDGKHISAYALCTILDFVAHTIIVVLPQGAKIDVLLYNGDLDLSCNPQSTELALESMEWSGKEEWMDPEKTPWQQWMIGKKKSTLYMSYRVDCIRRYTNLYHCLLFPKGDHAVGHSKKYDNLQFLVVYNSGHFVPTNQVRKNITKR